MKTVTITIPEDLDDRARAEARRQGISKSELIRRGLEALLPDAARAVPTDDWQALAGFGSPDIDVQPGDLDTVVYER